jgi:hypothetical protein
MKKITDKNPRRTSTRKTVTKTSGKLLPLGCCSRCAVANRGVTGLRERTHQSLTDYQQSNNADGSKADIGAVRQEVQDHGGTVLRNQATVSAQTAGNMSGVSDTISGRKLESHDGVKRLRRTPNGRNERETQKRPRLDHTLEESKELHSSPMPAPQLLPTVIERETKSPDSKRSKELHSSPMPASELLPTAIERETQSPDSKRSRQATNIAEGPDSAPHRITPDSVLDQEGSAIFPQDFFDDCKGVHPIAAMHISQFIPEETELLSDERHKTMVARSYQKWNPWGMKAVCGHEILQEMNCDEVTKSVSGPREGATSVQKSGYTVFRSPAVANLQDPSANLSLPVLSFPDEKATAFNHTPSGIVRGKNGYRTNPKDFFNDIEGLDPIDAIDISHLNPAKNNETSGEAQQVMMARSYGQWNPWGMKAVCGHEILQEIDWDEVK